MTRMTKAEQIFQAAAPRMHYAIHRHDATETGPQMMPIPVEAIERDEGNPRELFDEEALDRLAAVMKRQGQIQNCVVWRDPSTGGYRLTCGERRWRAAKRAGIPNLFCLVLPRSTALDMREEMAMSENTARENLRPVELAKSYKRLMDKHGWSGAELARNIGVAQSSVSEHLALLTLDNETQRKVDSGEVSKRAVVRKPTTTPRRRSPTGRRAPRGVHEFSHGTVKVKRGSTLADLVAEIQSAATRPAEAA
jgi:ParB/RepB/Spo0J family partition protein